MIGAVVVALAAVIAAQPDDDPRPAGSGSISESDAAAFIQKVQDYRDFVVPRCATELAIPYQRWKAPEMRAFVRSIEGTALRPLYSLIERRVP